MKKIIAAAALLIMAATTMTAQTKRVMTVIQKDGTQKEYKVNSVERVTFTDVELPSLRNQIAFDDNVESVAKVTLLEQGGNYSFDLYSEEADTANAVPTLRIVIDKDSMGQELQLGGEAAKVYYKGQEASLTGTLQVRFGRTGMVVINLESETAAYNDLRCRYTSNYKQVYEASNVITVQKGAAADSSAILSAFVAKPTTTGAATTFAFGDAEATTPDNLVNGTKAVTVSISALKLYGDTIDMANDPNSYTFQYIDYGTREAYSKVTAGTIVTKQDGDGNLYINLVATLDDGRLVTVDYCGPVVEADTIGNLVPEAVAENQFKYYNADGDLTIDRKIGTSYIKTDSKGNTTFYLVAEGESRYSDYKAVIKVSADLINAGELALDKLGDVAVFDLKFMGGSLQLQSYAAGHGYGNTPDNGKLTITKNDNDEYDITLDVVNHYKTMYGTYGGDNTHLVLHYTGTFEKY